MNFCKDCKWCELGDAYWVREACAISTWEDICTCLHPNNLSENPVSGVKRPVYKCRELRADEEPPRGHPKSCGREGRWFKPRQSVDTTK